MYYLTIDIVDHGYNIYYLFSLKNNIQFESVHYLLWSFCVLYYNNIQPHFIYFYIKTVLKLSTSCLIQFLVILSSTLNSMTSRKKLYKYSILASYTNINCIIQILTQVVLQKVSQRNFVIYCSFFQRKSSQCYIQLFLQKKSPAQVEFFTNLNQILNNIMHFNLRFQNVFQ